MSGQTQTRKPVAVSFGGFNPGQTPYVEIQYEDDRDTVQRLLDDSATRQLLIDAFGGWRAS